MIITDISQLDLTKQYTYADYLAWRIEERLELIKGWISRMAAPSINHQRVLRDTFRELDYYFYDHPCDLLFAPIDVVFRKEDNNTLIKTVVQPDICVVCDLTKVVGKICTGAPDLVVEILSPGNSKKEMKQKYEVYEENGVLEYWLVFPEEKSIQVFVRNEKGKFIGLQPFTEDDILTSTTFPGLNIDLIKVFKNIV